MCRADGRLVLLLSCGGRVCSTEVVVDTMSCVSIAACGGGGRGGNGDGLSMELSDLNLSTDQLGAEDSPYMRLLAKATPCAFYNVPNDAPEVRATALGDASDPNTAYRAEMQDVSVIRSPFGPNDDRILAAVFDGHGGADGSRLAAEFVVDAIHQEIGTRDPKEIMEDAFTASDLVFERDDVMFQGTTALVVVLEKLGDIRLLHLANVGDSRALLVSTSSPPMILHPLHTPDNPAEVERITTAGGFVARGKVNGMISVTRSLGNCPMKQVVLSDPFVTTVTLTGSETWLVLACDGVYDVLQPEAVAALVSNHQTAQAAAEAVVKEAIALSSTDNVSVVVVSLAPEI